MPASRRSVSFQLYEFRIHQLIFHGLPAFNLQDRHARFRRHQSYLILTNLHIVCAEWIHS